MKRKLVEPCEKSFFTTEPEIKKKKSEKNDVIMPKVSKKLVWTNKQRVMVFSQRGISYLCKHLMKDLIRLLPHSKTEIKLDRKSPLSQVTELCEMKNCNKCIFFQENRKNDIYMWLASIPNGPSVKFQVVNLYTMKELKLAGNSLLGSRPLLSFSPEFDIDCSTQSGGTPWPLLREMFVQTMGTPLGHPKSKAFTDRLTQFSIMDGRIWIRNYQIVNENTGEMCEIGPRLTLMPVTILESSFSGGVIYQNPDFVSPTKQRQEEKMNIGMRKKIRSQEKTIRRISRSTHVSKVDELETIFD